MTDTKQHDVITQYVLEQYPNEAVGVLLEDGSFVPLENKSKTPVDTFKITIAEYKRATKGQKNPVLIHSHTYSMGDNDEHAQMIRRMNVDRRQPSAADLKLTEKLTCKFGIVCTEGETVSPILYFNHCEKSIPYIGNDYVSGVSDDYSLVRRWCMNEIDVQLPLLPRDFQWQLNNPELDLYSVFDEVEDLKLIDARDIEHGDIVVMRVGISDTDICNHVGVLINDGEHHASLLHHLIGQLSGYVPYDRYAQYTQKVYRRSDL